jgi:hypothetical protein
MKNLFATVLIASLSGVALAQTPAPAPAKPAAKSATPAKPAAKPAPEQKVAAARRAAKAQAIEVATPLEEPDPRIKLSAAELEVAKRVHTGEIACELGQKVTIRPLKREGFFLVTRGVNRFVMHPVEARTATIRLEDPVRGGLWLQLGNKSMLMNQKVGQRLADECKSPEQVRFAKTMTPVDLLAAPNQPAAAAPAAGTQTAP